MTNELEKTFFDTFGIELRSSFRGCKLGAKYYAEICDEPTCKGCDEEIRKTEYPQISDRILLELICIISQYENLINISTNIQELKNNIINQIIGLYQTYDSAVCDKCDFQEVAELIKHQVRTLFEEG